LQLSKRGINFLNGLPPFTRHIYIKNFDEGSLLSVDLEKVYIENKSKDITLKINPLPKMMRDILSEGGVLFYLKNYSNFEI